MILKSPISVPPNPLAGPRTIGDMTNHIKIDPDNARIEYAGTARPVCKEQMAVPFYTQGGLAALPGLHNSTTIQYGFIDGGTRHLHAHILVGDYVDVDEDIVFRAVTYGNADISNLVVRNATLIESIRDGSTYSTLQSLTAYDYVHSSSTTARKAIVRELTTLSGGSGLMVGDMLQIDIMREGGHANDTLGTIWSIVGTPWIEFTRKTA